MRIASLDRSQLASARSVLAAACVFDRADVVADEKLFGLGPKGAPIAIGAWMSSEELASWTGTASAALTVGLTAGLSAGLTAGSSPNLTAASSLIEATPASSTAASPTEASSYGGEVLVGVASVCANRIRVLAVHPDARKRGVGSALLGACEETARANGATSVRTLDEPGNYLAPGVDERNTETIAWLERRGWQRSGELRENVLIHVRDNPRVTQQRLDSLITACATRGYEVRRARADEYALLDAVSSEFGGAWPFELARALDHETIAATSTPTSTPTTTPTTTPATTPATPATPTTTPATTPATTPTTPMTTPTTTPTTTPAVHVALRDGQYCAFAAHDGNNAGLGWFGPTGTWPAHRGNGLGEAVLVACLLDVAAEHEHCEVAWIGPRPFYDKVAGVASDRRFVLLVKTL
ncbi:MAG: GNAT family N-acetyltransferase [Kofleriaceae bacterium]